MNVFSFDRFYTWSSSTAIRLDQIRILPSFSACPPNNHKLESKREFYFQHGEYDRPLVVDQNGWLLDGYATYLIMLENGEVSAQVRVLDRVWISVKFDFRDGRSEWYHVPFEIGCKLSPGDRVLLRTGHKFFVVKARYINICPSERNMVAWGVKLPF